MNRIKTVAVGTKNFVVNHKTAVAVVVTALVVAQTQKSALKDQQEFIETHGLMDEFVSSQS